MRKFIFVWLIAAIIAYAADPMSLLDNLPDSIKSDPLFQRLRYYYQLDINFAKRHSREVNIEITFDQWIRNQQQDVIIAAGKGPKAVEITTEELARVNKFIETVREALRASRVTSITDPLQESLNQIQRSIDEMAGKVGEARGKLAVARLRSEQIQKALDSINKYPADESGVKIYELDLQLQVQKSQIERAVKDLKGDLEKIEKNIRQVQNQKEAALAGQEEVKEKGRWKRFSERISAVSKYFKGRGGR